MVSDNWWYSFTYLHYSSIGLCQLLSSTEGECSRCASGVMMRSGAGKHTSAGGVIYTGEWLEDKVCIFCVCTSLPLMSVRWYFLRGSSCVCSVPHRCMVEGPCSIPLEHYMKENSKTTCTTAREHTPSQTALLTKVTFMRTGKKQAIFGTCCAIPLMFPKRGRVLYELPNNQTVGLRSN